MSSRACCIILMCLVVPLGCLRVHAQSNPALPHLQKHGTATQLIVDKKPFLMLAGELGNSSASSVAYMSPVWERLQAIHLNTILMPVYWELVEPEEGMFDFALVDSLLIAARQHEMKIVVLWFGLWKNSMSCYAPAWVKRNQKRFPRARTREGSAVEILTPCSDENQHADMKAFAGLMKHLRVVDGVRNTVVMVQVENEIGMIPEARDYSPEAEKAFLQNVPPALMSSLQANNDSLSEFMQQAWGSAGKKNSGTWEQVFRKGVAAEEIFMAWYFATYTDAVVQAGKKEYPLPMYVNAALIRPNCIPGQYPSGGPLPHLMDVWRAAAPHIDFLAPDIYFRNFAEWLGNYDREGNGMFVPEVDRNQSATNAFYAFGKHNVMGYSPFSIESIEHPTNNQITNAYEVLRQLAPMILEHQGTGTMTGFLLDSAAQTARIQLGDYVFNVKHEYTWPYASRLEGETPRFGGLIIKTAKDEFFIAGSGVVVTFQTSSEDGSHAGIAVMEEGTFVNGTWVAGRRMNGDEDHQGRHMHLPGREYGIQRVQLYTYK